MASVYDRTTTYTPARQAYPDDRTAQTAETHSIVDRHSLFSGTFRTARDLRVEGTIEGEIACEGKIIIAQGARVKATITARELEVAGELDGETTCSGRFRITPTGNATGKVTAASLVIEEGARFNGDFSMMREGAPARPAERVEAPSRRRSTEVEAPPVAPESSMGSGETGGDGSAESQPPA
jgi:cytoskeletal protein CcmA (bactofilin family)